MLLCCYVVVLRGDSSVSCLLRGKKGAFRTNCLTEIKCHVMSISVSNWSSKKENYLLNFILKFDFPEYLSDQ